jgi:hypothetical protein
MLTKLPFEIALQELMEKVPEEIRKAEYNQMPKLALSLLNLQQAAGMLKQAYGSQKPRQEGSSISFRKYDEKKLDAFVETIRRS